MKKNIYLDNAATTRLDGRVLDAMMPYMTDIYGNASSLHFFGRQAIKAVDDARAVIARLLNAKTGEIYFTSGGTESDNWAVKGAAYALQRRGKHIITTSIEHPAMLETCRELEKQGFQVTYVEVDKDGVVSADDVKRAIRDDTILISVMFANNEVGSIQPIAEIGSFARNEGILFHTDAVQAASSIKLDVDELNVDMLSLSAHKFHGPKGIGLLYIRNGVRISKLIVGGHQERAARAGTTNTAGIVGMAKAFELTAVEMADNNSRIKTLRDYFIERVEAEVPFCRLNGGREHRLVSNANFSFDFIEGESILMQLDLQGIAVSSGSACSSGSLEPSHVMLAIGCPIEQAHSSIRFSLSEDTTKEEIDYTIQTLKQTVSTLRSWSPLFNVEKERVTMYSNKVLEAFANPKNVGEIADADGVGTVGNASCGDIMRVYLKIEDGVIVDAKFKTFGCAAAIASSSTATEMIKGMKIEDALKIRNADVVERLKGLPPQKIHCSVLAEEAIAAAIDDYRSKNRSEPIILMKV